MGFSYADYQIINDSARKQSISKNMPYIGNDNAFNNNSSIGIIYPTNA